MKQKKVYTFGKHALIEALHYAPQAVLKVYFDAKALDAKLLKLIQRTGVATAKFAEGQAKSDMRSGSAHQGIIGQISVHELVTPYRAFAESLTVTTHTSLVLFSGVQDPHNVGTIIRSAAAFGVAGVLLPQEAQSPITGTVLKVSAGMAFRIPLVSVQSPFEAIKDLKARGFKICGLAGGGNAPLPQQAFAEPTVFIVGNEGAGIPPEMRKVCDMLISIPMHPRAESLNVAASAATALYAWSARHPEALKEIKQPL